MRRAFGYAGAWLAVTSFAVTVSWFGCAIVLNRSSQQTPPVLVGLHSHRTAPVEPAVSVTMIAAEPQPTAAEPPLPPRSTAPHTSRSSRPAVPGNTPTTIEHHTPPAHHPVQTTVPTSVPPTPSPSPTPAPPSGQPTPTDETYQVTGGTAVLRFTDGHVDVLAMDPAGGYQAEIDQSRPDELLVIFKRDGQESDLHAAWDGGPSANVTEYWW